MAEERRDKQLKLKDVLFSALVGYVAATADFWQLGGWSRRLIIGLMAAVVFLAFLDWAEDTWTKIKQIIGVLRMRIKRRRLCTKGK